MKTKKIIVSIGLVIASLFLSIFVFSTVNRIVHKNKPYSYVSKNKDYLSWDEAKKLITWKQLDYNKEYYVETVYEITAKQPIWGFPKKDSVILSQNWYEENKD